MSVVMLELRTVTRNYQLLRLSNRDQVPCFTNQVLGLY